MSTVINLALLLDILLVATGASIITTQALEVFKFPDSVKNSKILNWIWSKAFTFAIAFLFAVTFGGATVVGYELWVSFFATIGAEAIYQEFIHEKEGDENYE